MKTRFTLLFLVFYSILSNAQTLNIAWQKCYGGSGIDKNPKIIARTDQSYTLGISTNSTNGDISGNKGEYDWLILKFDKNNAAVFNKIYGGTKTEDFSSIDENSDQTYLVTGTTNSTDGLVTGNHGLTDAWAMKLVSNGNTQWRKCIGGTKNDEGISAMEVENNNYLFLGSTESSDGDFSTNAGGKDIYLIKTDVNGIFVWTKTFGGSLDDRAVSMAKQADGYVIASVSLSSNGPATNSNHGGKDILLMKLDLNGSVVWAKFIGGSGDDIPTHLINTTDGNLLLTATSNSNNGDISGNHGLNDIWVAKISSTGAIIWSKSLGGTGDDISAQVCELSSPTNKYFVIGTTSSNNGNVSGAKGGKDIWIGQLNTSGVFEAGKNFGGSSDDVGTSIKVTFDKALLIAGETNSSDGNVVGNHGGGDAWVVKLTQPTSTFEEINDFEIKLAPNPTSQFTTLTWPTEVNVMDISINSITGIQHKLIHAVSGINTNTLDVSDLPSGHYIISLNAKQGTARKMLELIR